MEAVAMGLSVISTNISGIPELVKDGVWILVPPNDEKAIADAIVTLCKNSELRVGMGKNDRKYVVENIS